MARNRQIILAGSVGAGIAERLLSREQDKLEKRFSRSFLGQARNLARFVIKDQTRGNGQIRKYDQLRGREICVPVGKGGIFPAPWNLAEQENAGLQSAFDRIPIAQEFIEIFNYLDVNPYTSDDEGSVLIVTDDAETVIERLKKKGIPACRIGYLTENQARVIMRGETRCYLNKPERGGR